MTQSNENGSRLDRIESIMLELATASMRHDNEFSRINGVLERNSQQIEANTRQGRLNQESIHTLTASIQDLRNLVADYIQGRSQA
ncbi:MAG: hypothetical protein LH647_08710 [Leptolyngbyaceae cyanobacterium CAN_BIN12]|nr:hypothetical protein [Leptolyngbyaceae cyanobacterium CAN_BIN12]